MTDKVKTTLQFYEDKLDVELPAEYEAFKTKLGEIFGLQNDFMANLKLSYKGEPEEKLEVKTAEDYQNFVKYAKEKKESLLLEVEAKEGTDVNKNSVSLNISTYKQKNNLGNANQNAVLTFPIACSYCRSAPLYQTIYYCKDCNLIFCMQCEIMHGPQHVHPYFKVATKPHYAYLNIGGLSQIEKFMDSVETKFTDAYNSVIGFFGKKKENAQNKPEAKKEEKKEEKPEEKKEEKQEEKKE